MVVISEIWKHMNKVIFKGGVIDVSKMFALILLKVWFWVTSKVPSTRFFYSDWCLDLKLV